MEPKEETPDFIPENKLFSKIFGVHVKHFTCLITGQKGSGKTSLLVKLLRNSGIDYDHLYIFASTLEQPKYQYLIHGINNQLTNEEISFLVKDENSYFIDPEVKVKKISENKIIQPLDKVLCDQKPRLCQTFDDIDEIENLANKKNSILSKFSKNIFVFDDFLGLNNKAVNKVSCYMTNGRHFNCSVFFLTQDYSKILASVKKNTEIFIF